MKSRILGVKILKLTSSISIYFFILVGCSKSEFTNITLECSGKWTLVDETSHDTKNEKRDWFDILRVIELSDDLYDVEKHKYVWNLRENNNSYYSEQNFGHVDKDKYQSNAVLQVTTNLIEFNKVVYNDSPDRNQKYSYIISINRITGLWNEELFDKTLWRDGSWVSTRVIYSGKCEKAIKKF